MNYDVIIVGGGLAGLSLAVALRRSRLSVAVIEGRAPQRPEGWDARIYAVSPTNARFLDSIGIWTHLDTTRIEPVRKMAVRGDGSGALNFSAYDSGVGELAWIVESAHLQSELWESAKRQGNLDLLCPAAPTVLDIGDHEVVLELTDHRTLTAKLVVAADGADSWTRSAAGMTVDFQPYDQAGVVANFTVARPHRDVAYQWFRADGVLAYLPLPGNLISIVWLTPTAHAEELLALDATDFCEQVAAAGEYAPGQTGARDAAGSLPLAPDARTAHGGAPTGADRRCRPHDPPACPAMASTSAFRMPNRSPASWPRARRTSIMATCSGCAATNGRAARKSWRYNPPPTGCNVCSARRRRRWQPCAISD